VSCASLNGSATSGDYQHLLAIIANTVEIE